MESEQSEQVIIQNKHKIGENPEEVVAFQDTNKPRASITCKEKLSTQLLDVQK